MAIKEDLVSAVDTIFSSGWTKRAGTVVPTDTSVKLGNDGVELSATILYADLVESTKLVDSRSAQFSAEMYKAYLTCAAKIIKAEGGEITAYDGDRVMAVYISGNKNTAAMRTALKINWAIRNIINPLRIKRYSTVDYVMKGRVGIDTSSILVAKTGVRGANDLVWVGRAANHAAKLASLTNFSTHISDTVFDNSLKEVREHSDGRAMWTALTWNAMGGKRIYGSDWTWAL